MRILLADLETVWRGGQAQALLLLQGLRARGHQVELVCVRHSALCARAQMDGFLVHPCPQALRRAQAACAIRKLCRLDKFDVIHANEAHALTAAWLAGAHRQVPLAVSRRVAFALSRSRLARARYAAARCIIAVSHFVANSLRASGIPAAAVRVVHDGVPLPEPPLPEECARLRAGCNFSPDQPLAGCAGYLLPEKGQEALIRAFPAVAEKFPNLRLLLAGDGPCRRRLQALAEDLGVASAIRFFGHLENLDSFYRMLDLFLFPSLAEPLGSSLLTAMSYGLPVIAVASGGVPEVVDDTCGVLLPSPDPAKLGEAMIALLSNPERAFRLGAAARETITRSFTNAHMVEETLRVYSQLIA